MAAFAMYLDHRTTSRGSVKKALATVDSIDAEALGADDPIVSRALASLVETLERDARRAAAARRFRLVPR